MNAGSEVQGGSWLLNGRPIDVYTTVKALRWWSYLAEKFSALPNDLVRGRTSSVTDLILFGVRRTVDSGAGTG